MIASTWIGCGGAGSAPPGFRFIPGSAILGTVFVAQVGDVHFARSES
ncbi:MAG TPA: hypothetical protein VIU11_14875 [Nakamurella sp.]